MCEKISIIVTVYNIERYVDKCVESIHMQTYEELEIILIDDGSTDTSSVICDRWSGLDKRVKVFHVKNRGVSGARNEGIRNATGRYIIFVDGDDWLERRAVEEMVEYCAEGMLVTCGYYMDFENKKGKKSKQYRIPKGIISNKEIVSLFETGLFSPVWNKVYDLQVIRTFKIEFRENMNLGEDIVFNLEYLRKSNQKVCCIDKICYHYVRRNELSLDNRYCKEFQQCQKVIYSEFRKTIINDGEEAEDAYNRLNMLYFNALIVGIDNVYVNRKDFEYKQYKMLFLESRNNRSIIDTLKEMKGIPRIISEIRYFGIKHHLFIIDYYLRKFLKAC